MKYVIRKVPERDTTHLERNLPNALIYSDTEHEGCIESLIKAIELADDDAVYVQDDILLCPDFVSKAERIIAEHRSSYISFCNLDMVRYHKVDDWIASAGYMSCETAWMLCSYIPKWIAKSFVTAYRQGEITAGKLMIYNASDDGLMGKFLKYIGQDIYFVVPNIAGHPPNVSVMNSKRPPRWSGTFDFSDIGNEHMHIDIKYRR